jgi:4-amino-4-deoxy-L-arabinose transferase-like glycosyltransferase
MEALATMHSERRWKTAGLVLLALVALLMLYTVRDFGLTWDEEFHSTYGEYVLAWFTSGFSDERALSFKNSYIYGALFDVIAELFARLSPLGLYEDRHLVNVGFGILALAGSRRLGTLLLGPRGGTIALCLTALTPMFYGHSFNNPKDIPFAALFVWTLVYLYESGQAMPAVPLRATAKLTLGLGALLATRPAGIFFLAYVVVWWSLTLWRTGASQRQVHRAIGVLGAVALGGWLLMLTCWPWGQVSPIIHPIAGIAMASRFSYAMTTLFSGQQVPALHPPLSYLPTWFSLQLPETYLVAAAAAVAGCLFARRCVPRMEVAFLGFVVGFPIAIAIVLRSTLYDGVRHFLFIIPPLAILAAAGIESGLRPSVPRAVRALIAGAAVVAAALTAFDMVALHPYESIYFNRLVAGGLPGVSGRFETDYWGNSYRQATEWALANVPGNGIRIANCSNSLQTSYYLRGPEGARFIPVAKEDDPDLLLATTRWDCHRRPGARVLHTVERQGVALSYVLDLRP